MWEQYLPIGVSQINGLQGHDFDEQACLSESDVTSIETEIFASTGLKLTLSRRYLATLAKTTPQGAYESNVEAAIAQYGLVEETDWPNINDGNWDDFYAPIPDSVLAKGKLFPWKVTHTKINPDQVPASLEKGLIKTIMTIAGSENHAVAMYKQGWYFDSYAPFKKAYNTYDVIISDILITITPKCMLPIYKKVVKQDGKTFGVLIETPNGCQIIYATTQEQWISWSSPTSYGLQTVNTDGTPNWTADITLPF